MHVRIDAIYRGAILPAPNRGRTCWKLVDTMRAGGERLRRSMHDLRPRRCGIVEKCACAIVAATAIDLLYAGRWKRKFLVMSLVCAIEFEDGCLKLRVSGTFRSREETFRVMDRLKAEADAQHCKCALLNLIDAQGHTSDIDKFYLGEYAARVFGGKLKVAVVFPADGITKFGENVAVNRGAKLAVLASEPEAMAWLGGDK
jgi:hypothetical protein